MDFRTLTHIYFHHINQMFVFFSSVCFLCGLFLPFMWGLKNWDPFAIGPIVICSIICLFLLTLQTWEILMKRSGVFIGQIYLLWSMLHMLAALSSIDSEIMVCHFLFQFSSVCWQISHQIMYAQ